MYVLRAVFEGENTDVIKYPLCDYEGGFVLTSMLIQSAKSNEEDCTYFCDSNQPFMDTTDATPSNVDRFIEIYFRGSCVWENGRGNVSFIVTNNSGDVVYQFDGGSGEFSQDTTITLEMVDY